MFRCRVKQARRSGISEIGNLGEPRDEPTRLRDPPPFQPRCGPGKSIAGLQQALRSRAASEEVVDAQAKSADEPPSPDGLSQAGSIPKSLSIASVAMSLSMASIASETWELNADWATNTKDEDHDVGLRIDAIESA